MTHRDFARGGRTAVRCRGRVTAPCVGIVQAPCISWGSAGSRRPLPPCSGTVPRRSWHDDKWNGGKSWGRAWVRYAHRVFDELRGRNTKMGSSASSCFIGHVRGLACGVTQPWKDSGLLLVRWLEGGPAFCFLWFGGQKRAWRRL
ncbi:hypothetical protein E2562_012223 [Oryza meyeriana var. granulata]|uniref:Uncharacterized protein n=1 Tax=Oryza meyeriana var. granulata TaxID=110450 RepID=A0A6G1D2T8_9ORYZ|nr:hypothetical protein E2562_012223 [Oryza meyeriana var. granulata]